jgi:hypothetical protein
MPTPTALSSTRSEPGWPGTDDGRLGRRPNATDFGPGGPSMHTIFHY